MANIDYAKLLRDRRLDIAIGIGYEFAGEKPGFSNELNVIVAILKANRFIKKTIAAADPYYDTYFLRKKFTGANLKPIDIDIYIYLTSSHKKAPAQVFASLLSTSEIVIYSGHARVGIGPDFDDEKLLEGKTMDDIIKAMNEYEKMLSPEHKNRKSIYFSD